MKGKVIPFRIPDPASAEACDDELVSSCAAGKPAALGLLFDRHHMTVHRVLGRLPGAGACDLEDLVQQTFIEVYLSAPRFDGRSTVRTWIVGIAINVARHHVRGEVRRRVLERRAAELSPADTAGHRDAADRLNVQDRLLKVLAGLPRELGEAFVLCDLEEFKGSEAARILSIPEGTLWRRLHEARKRLREALKEEVR